MSATDKDKTTFPNAYSADFRALLGSRIFPWEGRWPGLAGDVFLAPGARVIGDVELAAGVSVWFNAVIRADVNSIRVGTGTNIQDNATLHVSGAYPLVIGSEVVVGHGAILHGCTVADRVLVGMGAIILDAARVASDVLIAAGAVVPAGLRIPSGCLLAGVPARIVRDLSAEEIASIGVAARQYQAQAAVMLRTLAEFPALNPSADG